MTFSQIPYQRADLAGWKQQMQDIIARFKAAKTFEEADAIYVEAATFDESSSIPIRRSASFPRFPSSPTATPWRTCCALPTRTLWP